MSRSKLKQIENNPGSNFASTISWTILAFVAIVSVYNAPIQISHARFISVAEGINEGGVLHLATISEPDQKPERLEVSQPQAKMLKNWQHLSKTCYIKASITNGIIPIFSDRRLVYAELKNCQ